MAAPPSRFFSSHLRPKPAPKPAPPSLNGFEMQWRVCRGCGGQFQRTAKPAGAKGAKQVYCKPPCQKRSNYRRRRDA